MFGTPQDAGLPVRCLVPPSVVLSPQGFCTEPARCSFRLLPPFGERKMVHPSVASLSAAPRCRKRKASGITSRQRPFQAVEPLEDRRLLAFAGPASDDTDGFSGGCPICGAGGCAEHMGVDGNVFVKCVYQPSVAPPSIASQRMAPVAPLADTFKLHSLPSATKKIYLDFDGHVTTGTFWQNGASFDTPAFSLDSNYAQFSDAERQAIQEVWARVAEDFYPFDVDVTTEEPPLDDLRNTGAGDTRWGMRVVIGGNGNWMSGAAGVAYLNSFSWNSDTPCFVFADQSWKTNLNFMATCVSHEVGHTLGLRHDGHNGREYYGGRGSGETGWGPIMGNPGFVNLTQWSRGEYGGSTNREDDLSIITTRNGFGYRPDDHGGTTVAATQAPSGDFEVPGFIGQSSDVDMFRFTTSGQIQATISPISVGTNLDILASLIDSAGTTVATSNPTDKVGASFTLTVAAGTYFLAVRGTGMGDINTTGYTAYGSLGQYIVKVGTPSGPVPSLSVADARVTEGSAGITSVEVAISLSAAAQQAVTVNYATADGSATLADGDYLAATGSVTFAAGETRKTVVVQVRGDAKVEADESFVFRLSGPSGAVLGDGEAAVTIGNDDSAGPALPAFSVSDVSVVEGNSGTKTATFTVTLSAAAQSNATVQYSTADGTARTADSDYTATSGVLSFAPGQTTRTVSVTVIGDAKLEADETFSFILSGPSGATLARATAVGTITNDDAAGPPAGTTVSVADASISEGNAGIAYANFVITLSAPAAQPVLVRYTTADRTAAVFDRDYMAAVGSVAFAVGETSKTVSVAVMGDTRLEVDETFSFIISSAVGATIARGTGVGTITNDETPLSTGISIADSQVTEGNSGLSLLSFVVSLSSPAGEPVTVRFRTVGGTATAGSDYAAATGELRFARGGIRQVVNVWVQGDRVLEQNETFSVELFGASGATISRATATGTIRNDDVSTIQALAFAQLAAAGPSGVPKRPSFVR